MNELWFFNELLFILYFYILTEISPFMSLYIERRCNNALFHSQNNNNRTGIVNLVLAAFALSILNGLKAGSHA